MALCACLSGAQAEQGGQLKNASMSAAGQKTREG
jgi:hypothetical protein